MVKTLGYMVTWRTYGTWLEGDSRGYVKKGKVLAGDKSVMNRSKSQQKGGTVRLGAREKRIVREAILEKARKVGQRILATAVYSKHVHLVVGYEGRPVEETVRRYKNVASAALRTRGVRGRVWTRGYDKRFCFDEKALKERMAYVMRHRA